VDKTQHSSAGFQCFLFPCFTYIAEVMENSARKQRARVLRNFRKIHRITGIILFVFFIILGVTGILLGWKKNSGGLIQAKTHSGSTKGLSGWLPLDSLQHIAVTAIRSEISRDISTEIDKIDIRPEKGMMKVIFKDHYHGLQIDGVTGAILHREYRTSDLIEHIHDGTIIDNWLNLPGGAFKLFYTAFTGFATIVFSVTGFWLWYGPKRMRKH